MMPTLLPNSALSSPSKLTLRAPVILARNSDTLHFPAGHKAIFNFHFALTFMKYEIILRRIRQRIFDYPPELEEKAMRVLGKVKARKIAQQPPPPERKHWMYAAE